MSKLSNIFGVKLTNIPLLNLRMEFNSNYTYVKSSKFEDWHKSQPKPADTRYLTWYGMPDEFITLVVQRAVLGLEAYVPGTVFTEAGLNGRLTKKITVAIRNPFTLGGRRTVDNYYNLLPALLNPGFSLKEADKVLWDRHVTFYECVRNPIFHGCNFHSCTVDVVRGVFAHLAKVYLWVDSWHHPNNLWPGASVFSKNINKLLDETPNT